MIRRQPTTIQLTQEDLLQLEEELEEHRLQQQIRSQQRNLLRSSTKVPSTVKQTDELVAVDSSFQFSPLQKQQQQQQPSQSRQPQLPLSQHGNSAWESRTATATSNGVINNNNSTSTNPFYSSNRA